MEASPSSDPKIEVNETSTKTKKSSRALGSFGVAEKIQPPVQPEKVDSIWQRLIAPEGESSRDSQAVIEKRQEKSVEAPSKPSIEQLDTQEQQYVERQLLEARTQEGELPLSDAEASKEAGVGAAAIDRFRQKVTEEGKDSDMALIETLDEIAQGTFDEASQAENLNIHHNGDDLERKKRRKKKAADKAGKSEAIVADKPAAALDELLTRHEPKNTVSEAMPPHGPEMPAAAGVAAHEGAPVVDGETAPVYEHTSRNSDLLLGGIVGYLIGRRRGRIKSERKFATVQRELEANVRELAEELQYKEATIRQAAVERLRERQSLPALLMPAEAVATIPGVEAAGLSPRKQVESHLATADSPIMYEALAVMAAAEKVLPGQRLAQPEGIRQAASVEAARQHQPAPSLMEGVVYQANRGPAIPMAEVTLVQRQAEASMQVMPRQEVVPAHPMVPRQEVAPMPPAIAHRAERRVSQPAPLEAIVPSLATKRSREGLEAKTLQQEQMRILVMQAGVEALELATIRNKLRTPAPELIENLPKEQVLELSQKVVVEGQSLRQAYENGQIGEKGLRRLIAEHLRGHDITEAFQHEMVQHQVDFERDPMLRDKAAAHKATQITKPQAMATATASLQQLLKKADVDIDDNKVERQAELEARALAEEKHQAARQHQQRVLDLTMGGVIVGLITTIIVILVAR